MPTPARQRILDAALNLIQQPAHTVHDHPGLFPARGGVLGLDTLLP
jgi:hypothetical protein